jgi:replication factor C subunit 1
MIKNTTVPIICICNDRQSEKIRSLAGHCFDIKFHKPNKQMIAKRLKDIV